jgi:HTH-type transcriptional regulator/antitoxin HigA
MNWKVIKTETAYKKAVKRTMAIFNALPGTADGDELELLLVLVKDYEDKNMQLN